MSAGGLSDAASILDNAQLQPSLSCLLKRLQLLCMMLWLNIGMLVIHCVSEKLCQLTFCSMCVEYEPISVKI